MPLAPIVLFTYNRPWHVRQTIEALQKNDLSAQSELIVFSDGPKNEEARSKVEEVRKYLKTITGFKRIQIYERKENQGLANSIIDGVTKIVNEYGSIIVLEDDLVTSPYFLRYMNEALDIYKQDDRVISIHGYVYSVQLRLPETFFLKGADCLGWATWKRGWELFEGNGMLLLKELKDRGLTREFDFNDTYPYTNMLIGQSKGKVGSWAIRWYASAFLKNKLTLYPGRSLVFHNGSDGTGTNSGLSSWLDVKISQTPVQVGGIEMTESVEGRKAFEKFLRTLKGSPVKRIKKVLGAILRCVKPIFECVLQIESWIARSWVSSTHRRLMAVQWGFPPNPEHFDHHIDLFYHWLASRNSLWLERGVFGSLALQGGEVLELACGDGFNARNFYSLRSKHVVACDFDAQAIETARRKNSAPNVKFVLADIRTAMPAGKFQNIVWDAAIEHFTTNEIEKILKNIKSRLTGGGIVSGYTIVEKSDGMKSLSQHEYEFKSKEDLLRFFTPHFKNVTVFETIYPSRHNLFFWASDGSLPFRSDWPNAISKSRE